MALVIPVAHDFSCPWCWIGLSQAKRLAAEFDVKFQWLGYELFPEELDWPEESAPKPAVGSRPKTPSRFALAMAAEGLGPLFPDRPGNMRTFRAHHALEFAKDHGCGDALLDRLYRAHWQSGLNINEPEVIRFLIAGLGLDWEALTAAVDEKRYRDRLVYFDDDAYASGVYNVPTFFINGEKFAEQPYSVLREAVAKVADAKPPIAYAGVSFPPPSDDRPWVYLNMIATIDGKIVTGKRNEPVPDLGSAVDHSTMRYLESLADGILIGAGNLRATPKLWYDSNKLRFVATRSGDLEYGTRFFSDCPERAHVIAPSTSSVQWRNVLSTSADEIDWNLVLKTMRHELGVQQLLVEGGSELNASLFSAGLIDEIFLTVSPKIKLGRETPTLADGTALSRDVLQSFDLISSRPVGNEVFLRYRRAETGATSNR